MKINGCLSQPRQTLLVRYYNLKNRTFNAGLNRINEYGALLAQSGKCLFDSLNISNPFIIHGILPLQITGRVQGGSE
jgi:hypothetical protein